MDEQHQQQENPIFEEDVIIDSIIRGVEKVMSKKDDRDIISNRSLELITLNKIQNEKKAQKITKTKPKQIFGRPSIAKKPIKSNQTHTTASTKKSNSDVTERQDIQKGEEEEQEQPLIPKRNRIQTEKKDNNSDLHQTNKRLNEEKVAIKYGKQESFGKEMEKIIQSGDDWNDDGGGDRDRMEYNETNYREGKSSNMATKNTISLDQFKHKKRLPNHHHHQSVSEEKIDDSPKRQKTKIIGLESNRNNNVILATSPPTDTNLKESYLMFVTHVIMLSIDPKYDQFSTERLDKIANNVEITDKITKQAAIQTLNDFSRITRILDQRRTTIQIILDFFYNLSRTGDKKEKYTRIYEFFAKETLSIIGCQPTKLENQQNDCYFDGIATAKGKCWSLELFFDNRKPSYPILVEENWKFFVCGWIFLNRLELDILNDYNEFEETTEMKFNNDMSKISHFVNGDNKKRSLASFYALKSAFHVFLNYLSKSKHSIDLQNKIYKEWLIDDN